MSVESTRPRVRVRGVTRRFGGVSALHDVDMDIADGEFVTLLGPSGCGKTTLLRIIGGFDRPTSGSIELSGVDVTGVPAHKRRVNMVFQRPTMFPNLDVRGNVGFGLRIAGVPKADIPGRVDEALDLVRLAGYGDRRSHELSGGQLQRVALARALVNRPEVLLLDEPLSALDLTIRLGMEEELRRLHRELGATFVYVTHDQREALALSDRVAVMSDGRVEQIGTPNIVYHEPVTPFVARLVGDSNVLAAVADEHGVTIGSARLAADTRGLRGAVWAVLRPETAILTDPGVGALPGVVVDAAFRGTGFSYRIRVDEVEAPVKVEVAGRHGHSIGDALHVRWPAEAVRVIARDGSPS